MTSGKRKYKPRWPIREYLGKYEAFLLKWKHVEWFYMADKALEKFLAYFPDFQGWEQFQAADVEDFQIVLDRNGYAPKTIWLWKNEVAKFYQWLSEDCGWNFPNPARPKSAIKRNSRLSHDDFWRLLDYCSLRLYKYLVDRAHGRKIGIPDRWIQKEFKVVVRKVKGTSWMRDLADFEYSIRGLWREIMFPVSSNWDDIT